jgi:hypothetical protein
MMPGVRYVVSYGFCVQRTIHGAVYGIHHVSWPISVSLVPCCGPYNSNWSLTWAKNHVAVKPGKTGETRSDEHADFRELDELIHSSFFGLKTTMLFGR